MTLKKFMQDHIAHGRTAKGQPAAPATIQKWIPAETFLNEVFPKRTLEVFSLKWGDVLWEQGKLLVRIPKTEHHEGCDIRFVPLRDIREYLQDAFQDALPAGQHRLPADAPIITRVSRANSNLDKPFVKIVESAGLVPWPKLFQNLRASCETQWLKEGERADLVANWIGHSVTVQRKNYVQHTDDDIHSFNEKPAFKSGTHSGTVEPQIMRNGDKPHSKNTGKTRKPSVFAGEFNPTRT
jgi:hypothetical protein